MPLYMDIHHNADATPDDVMKAHLSDLEAQEKFGVKYLKYWHNPHSKTICCLVNAPDPEAAHKCHLEAHGLTADKIIEVQNEVVEAFLGGSVDGGLGRMLTREGDPDGGFRTVLFTDIAGSTSMTQRLGDSEAMKIIRAHDALVQREIEARKGRVVKHTGDGTMAAFPAASAAIYSAMAIQKAFRVHNERLPDRPIEVRIGMSAGEPVDEGQDLFGVAVQLARRVCDAAEASQIRVSNVVRELCVGKDIRFNDLGPAALRGFDEPVQMFEVHWS